MLTTARRRGGACLGAILRSSSTLFLGAAIFASNAQAQEAPLYWRADGKRTTDLDEAAKSWVDDEFRRSGALGAINAQFAYAFGLSGEGITLGNTDTGADFSHPEFAGRLTSINVSGVRSVPDKNIGVDAGAPFDLRGDTPFGRYGSHGTETAGLTSAARDGKGMHGVAFASHSYIGNPGLTGEVGIQPINFRDVNILAPIYQKLMAAGVRIINQSWGDGAIADTEHLVSRYGQRPAYSSFDVVANSVSDSGTGSGGAISVWSAGNHRGSFPFGPPSTMPSLPFLRPGLEKNWIAVAALDRTFEDLASYSNLCGIAKFWCISAPADGTWTAGLNGSYNSFRGTSAAAPVVSGALALVMERYPYLTNEQARDVLLTTAKPLGTGPAGVPDARFGWGVVDLKKAMFGPGQLLGAFNVRLDAGASDTWSNDISDVALQQRQKEDVAEIASWRDGKARLGLQNGFPADMADRLMPQAQGQLPAAKQLVTEVTQALISMDYAAFFSRADDVKSSDPAKSLLEHYFETSKLDVLLAQQDARVRNALKAFSEASEADLAKIIATAQADTLRYEHEVLEPRIAALSAKGEADYLGSLVKSGAGTLRLTGKSSYRGDTLVNGGLLAIDGSIASRTVVNQGGTLGGTGSVGDLVARAGGVVAPGNSIGTLKADAVTFDRGSTLAVEFAADGRSDRLVVDNKAVLLGGVVMVSAEAGSDSLRAFVKAAAGKQDYAILTASQSVSGRFEETRSPYRFFSPRLSYGEKTVSLAIERLAFRDAGRSFNEKQAADGIESLGAGNALHDSILASRITDDPASVFAAAAGDIHATLRGELAADDRFVRDAAIARSRGPAPHETPWVPSIWGQAYGSVGSASGDGNAAGFERRLGGLVAGTDGDPGQDFTLGMLAGYAATSMDAGKSSASVDSYRLGLYGGKQWSGVGLRLGATYAHHVVETSRSVSGTAARTGYSGNGMQFFGEAGYEVAAAGAVFEPFAGLAYTHLRMGGFRENDAGGFGLDGTAGTTDLTTTMLGLRASYAVTLGEGTQARFAASAGWRHAFGDTTPDVSLRLAGGDPFTNRGLQVARDAFALTAGVNVDLSANATVGLHYDGQIASDATDNAFKANLSVKF